MKLVTYGDFYDIYIKVRQNGLPFLLNRLKLGNKKKKNTKWNTELYNNSAIWNIPFFVEKQNEIISGDKNTGYVKYFCSKYITEQNLTLLSVGSGTGFYEREFAKYCKFKEITGVELAQNRVKEAEKLAKNANLHINYICQNFCDIDFGVQQFDIILFHQSLHHFENINGLLKNKIKHLLRPSGYLIVNEYVGNNRLYINKAKLKEVNKLLTIIPEKYRLFAGLNILKNKVHNAGLIRMLINDPSEAPDSKNIVSELKNNFELLEEKNLGWTLLMPLMKNIAHNFMSDDEDTLNIFNLLYNKELEYTAKTNKSDYYFGIYKNKNN